jgi:Tfp pilus assembly protein PilF
MTRNGFFVLLALALSACAQLHATPGSTGSAGSREPAPETGSPPPASPTAALLEQGRRQSADGEVDQAAASLERALRIEPGNPWLWLELAQIHRSAGNDRQAEAHARKALSLAGTDRTAEQAARRFLEE